MRTTLAALALLAAVITACGAAQPGTPAPTVLGTEGPGQATGAPMPHY
ncbi:MAG TPA: hypothetical protein VGT60_11040 [Candidatus Limnocylindria bacterium]|nr:hypothetical protein [Candidatus Limnocylindria bacterium]